MKKKNIIIFIVLIILIILCLYWFIYKKNDTDIIIDTEVPKIIKDKKEKTTTLNNIEKNYILLQEKKKYEKKQIIEKYPIELKKIRTSSLNYKFANAQVSITYNSAVWQYNSEEFKSENFYNKKATLEHKQQKARIDFSYIYFLKKRTFHDTGGQLYPSARKFKINKATFLNNIFGQRLYYYAYYDNNNYAFAVIQKMPDGKIRQQMPILNNINNKYNYEKFFTINIIYNQNLSLIEREKIETEVIEILKTLTINKK